MNWKIIGIDPLPSYEKPPQQIGQICSITDMSGDCVRFLVTIVRADESRYTDISLWSKSKQQWVHSWPINAIAFCEPPEPYDDEIKASMELRQRYTHGSI